MKANRREWRHAVKKALSIILSICLLLSITAGLSFSATATDYQGVKTVASNLKTGDTFQMGNYPQSRITDETTLNALNSISCTMKSYGYMQNSNADTHTYDSVDMTYADISYNGKLYRKVTISEYRPWSTSFSSNASNTFQENSGYKAGGNSYYFKWEPIVWQVLDCEDDGVYVMSKSLLDSQAYNNFYEGVTWETSSLRNWLNNDFYNSAFSANEKKKILTRAIANENNPNYGTVGGNDTTDKLWLLSYSDSIYANYGFSTSTSSSNTRTAQGTDYAKSQGLWDNSTDSYSGNSSWWLRTPGVYSVDACSVNHGGNVNNNVYVYYTDVGVRPAFKLNLNSEIFKSDAPQGGDSGEEFENEETIFHGENEQIAVKDVIGESKNFTEYVSSLDSSTYNPKLAYMLAGLSRSAYDKSKIKESYKSLGFNDPKTYNYTSGNIVAAHTIGKKTLNDGSTLVMVTARGTEDIYNWLTNLNLNTVDINKGNHLGFDISANTVFSNLKDYLGGEIPTTNVKYVITGHSLGAATGNLLAVKLSEAGVPISKIYDYNFACPDVVRGGDSVLNHDGNHNNIFNIGSAKDAVSVIPGVNLDLAVIDIKHKPEPWGKYGKSYWFSNDWNKSSEIDIKFTIKGILNAHDAKKYVDYLAKFKSISNYKNYVELKVTRAFTKCKTIIHAIFCPVDVDVYDNNGKLVASVKNNEIVKLDEGSDVLVFVEGDKKYVQTPADKNYDIRLTGNDTGTMTYTAVKADLATQEIEAQKTFENVALTDGKAMETSSVANAEVEDTKLYVIDDESDIIAEIATSGKETKKVSMNKVKVTGIKSKTYTGKSITQSITVKKGNTVLKKGTNYTVSYKNNKKVGTATVTITGKGKYIGTIKKTFKINPKGTAISKVTSPKSKQVKVTWKKQSTQTTGYQIQYATSSKFTPKTTKTVTVSKNKTTSKTIKKLKGKKKYYVRIRTYKTVNGKYYYSSWSKAKTVTTKK